MDHSGEPPATEKDQLNVFAFDAEVLDPELAALGADLRAVLVSLPAPAVMSAHLAAMSAAFPITLAPVPGSPVSPWAKRAFAAGGVAAAAIFATAGLAAAGSLPTPVQNGLAEVVAPLGIVFPHHDPSPPLLQVTTNDPTSVVRSGTPPDLNTTNPSTSLPAPARPETEVPATPPVAKVGEAPGQTGATPGQSGAEPPGQSGANPGHLGEPGQPGKDTTAQKKAEQEKAEQEKLAQEKLAQEKLAQEKADQEKLAQEKLAQEKADQDAGVSGSGTGD